MPLRTQFFFKLEKTTKQTTLPHGTTNYRYIRVRYNLYKIYMYVTTVHLDIKANNFFLLNSITSST